MSITRFEDLEVWKKARDLSLAVYRVTSEGSFARDFGLRDQIRRAAVSVMSNIAEGFDRYSRSEFKQFLSIARGSASEVRSQLYLAHALGYLGEDDFVTIHGLCLELGRMLASRRSIVSTR
jgi:four helix bundle protein